MAFGFTRSSSEEYNEKRPSGPLKNASMLSIHSQEYDLAVISSNPHASTKPVGPGPGEGHRLRKDLKPRHITMIAIGGALGTGLLIGTSSSLTTGGGGSTFVAYAFVGLIVYFVMAALGEMASFIPLPDGFPGYASRYADPALGFAVGYSYLCKYLITTPNQLVAGSLVMQYWVSSDTVNPGVWIAILLVIIVLINLIGVKYFGEIEFWLSSLKVLTVVGLIILLLVIMLGGGPTHDRLGFRYWTNPGAFKTYKHIEPASKGKFIGFFAVLVYAVFAYLGTELVGITFGEAKNPRHSIKKAIRLTFFRILFFYILSCFLLACCVAYNDPLLVAAKGTSAAASPFVVAIRNAQIGGLPHVVNACILIFIISASNSDMYIASRTLYGLSANGKAPKIFSKTNKLGVPYYALAVSALFSCLAFMACSSSSKKVFNYLVNVVSIFGLLTWISILITYLHFYRAILAQGIDRARDLAYVAPFQPYGSWFALVVCIIIALIKNFTVFIEGFDYKTFITGYIGIPVYAFCYIGYKVVMKSKTIPPLEVDLVTFKDVIDAEEEEGWLEMEREKELLASKGKFEKGLNWIYRTCLGWLF